MLKACASTFQVYLCGNSTDAKQAVSEVATKLGLSVLDRGGLSAARELEDFPLELFPEWRLPMCVALGLTVSFYVYLLLRDVVYAYVMDGKDISFRMMVSLANKVKPAKCFLLSGKRPLPGVLPVDSLSSVFQAFPIVSLVMLSLCYLPGIIAAFLQLYRGTKYK